MSADIQMAPVSGEVISLAKPIHIQKLEKALHLEPLLNYVEAFTKSRTDTDTETSTDADTDYDIEKESDGEGNKIYNGVVISKAERKADKSRLYNFSKVKKGRKWLKNVLLSDTSSDEELDGDKPMSKEYLHSILKQHRYLKKYSEKFHSDHDLHQYQYYSVGLLSHHDKYLEHQKLVLGPRRKALKEQKKLEKKFKKVKLKKMRDLERANGEAYSEIGRLSKEGKGTVGVGRGSGPGTRTPKAKKITPEQMLAKRRKLWISLSKKEIPKQQKSKVNARKEVLSNLKKVAKECQKECRRAALQSQKIMKEAAIRARRLSKEMMVYWKRFEKVEKEHRKRAEKEAQEQRKMDLELLEMKRQQRKLNFLITQTELYAHFMARKMIGGTEKDKERILGRLDEKPSIAQKSIDGTAVTDVIRDQYDSEEMKAIALKNAEDALRAHQMRTAQFDARTKHQDEDLGLSSLANPTISTAAERPQPSIFQGKLKDYQLKGMNWLANLYDQGINGILADEMGLGKTVQSIALLAYMAEVQNIWGPFLVVAPASTLHNWQQEVSKFLPAFKVVPYWGNTQDRKILRKFWNQDNFQTEDASFHMVITSYQLVIQDVRYFQKIRWHYMILDEAQAIKSTASARWKVLLGFNCRNRLLLTGTPIQNSMGELWALLHFIMPTLFDSHDEFNEWFSKDIESHAEKQSGIDENQLSRLHMILKPFMLRRIKKDVENELSDKIEILVYCPFTLRQKLLYQGIKNKISIDDLLQSSTATNTQAQNTTSSLMNLVMQFRKVCNHPELFERRDIRSPFFLRLEPYLIPKLVFREGLLETAIPSKRHIVFNLLYIFSPAHIHQSLFHESHNTEAMSSTFSFSRFTDLSPAELYGVMLKGLLYRWLLILKCLKKACHIRHRREWDESELREVHTRHFDNKALLLEPDFPGSASNISQTIHLKQMVFVSPLSPVYAFLTHTIHYIPETAAHRKIRLHRHSARSEVMKSPVSGKKLGMSKTPLSPGKKHFTEDDELVHPHIERPPIERICQQTEIPSFLSKVFPKVHGAPIDYYCCDRSALWQQKNEQLCGSLEAAKSLLYGTPEMAEQVRWSRYYFCPAEQGGLMAIKPKHGFSGVLLPDKEMLVTDAGKLFVLDSLLQRLKIEGHRVLIYSQMTRMIDILEEYMWHRKHTYMRLDGSSKISERRDMVADFQNRSDIFVFLLSTRAGGLGINLTAADTVIFYDSDWNPTVDQQAMDRAHRLGQTKQVTVYRLICKGTIEERILQRAREKSEIQRMVISGGNYRPDVLKPKEVVSLLLDDDEMEKKLRQRQEEKKLKDDGKCKEKKRKPYTYIPGVARPHSGRGPGRPPKRLKLEEAQKNVTIPATEMDGNISVESVSGTGSPQSVMSVGSEVTQNSAVGDESSNDALVIVDDSSQTSSTPTTPSVKRGRPRGRPRGSGVGRRPRGRGSVQKALGAAEAAAAQAAKKAAYEAYGYSFSDNSASPTLKNIPANYRPTRRGRGRGRGSHHAHRPVS